MGVGGIPVVAQFFAAVSSSSTSPQLTSTGSHTGQFRAGYGREGGLRASASLQDFSTYRTGVLSNGVPRSPSLVGPFGSSPPQQVPRNDGGPATLTSIKSNIGRRSSGAVTIPICNDTVCTRGKIIVAMVALVAILLLVNSLWARDVRLQDEPEYAVVIDCGSTGSRAHVYGWIRKDTPGKELLPVVVHPSVKRTWPQQSDGAPTFDKRKTGGEGRPYKRMETEPGLDKLLHNASGVTAAIGPLIHWATTQIPQAAHKKTQLFFLATAGLRRLAPADSKWLLDRSWVSLVQSPFMCRREWVRVISGQEEAYFGWIALNYKLNRLGQIPKQPTLGALDLGGSSLEVTFEPEEMPKSDYLVNVTVGSVEHHLYALSHPGFGLNDAFEKSVALLMERGAPSVKDRGKSALRVAHPCLNLGYRQPFTCSSYCVYPPPDKGGTGSLTADEGGLKVELFGKPNWTQCQSLAQSVINVSGLSYAMREKDCEQAPCALGRHQPHHQGQFFALAGFFVVYNFFGLTATNSLDDLLLKGQQFCKLRWEDAQRSVVIQPSIDRYCFRAPYVVSLLRHGLHLNDEQVLVGDGDFAWTLGAALNEAGALHPAMHQGAERSRPSSWLRQSGIPLDVHFFTFLFVVIIFAFILLTCSWKWIPSRPWHRPYLPLFVQPTPSGGPFSWLLSFYSRLRPGSSPAPAAATPELLSGASMASSGGRSQVQLAKMQHKGGSRLQSRRTQSREDLSSYVSLENPHSSKVLIARELSPVRICTPLRHEFTM